MVVQIYSLSFLLLFSLTCTAVPLYSEQKIVYMTIPKGGSQLIRKAIGMITARPFRRLPQPEIFQENELPYLDPLDPTIVFHHLEAGYEVIRCATSGRYCKIVMIRDPRDVIVSMAEWIHAVGHTALAKLFMGLPVEKQIAELIECPNLKMNGILPFVFDTKAGIQEALLWMNDPSVHICRFEDLVGPLGGGSKERQLEAVHSLAQHMGYDLPQQEIEEISENLFGGTMTFRQGMIGEWRKVFTPEHVELFKNTMGCELVSLGYEWDD
ncbi:MAG: hypothetical protein WCF65_03420 [Parachlamydiaceae bacterium]